jgi:hypothetical protein
MGVVVLKGAAINLFGPDTLSELVGASFLPAAEQKAPLDGAYPRAAP